MGLRKYLFWVFMSLFSLVTYAQSDYFWIGGSGNWSDIAHWATSSGGTQNFGVIPSPQDNVIFDENSFAVDNQSLNINVSRATFKDMDWSKINRSIRMTGSGELESYGSIILSDQVSFEFNGPISFRSGETGEVFKTANHEVNGGLSFEGGGEWTLEDSLKLTQGNGIDFGEATILSQGEYILVDFIEAGSDETRIFDITNSTVELRAGFNTLNLNSDNLSLTATDSEIRFTNQNPSSHLFNITGSKSLTFGSVSFLGTDGISKINNSTGSLLIFHDILFKSSGLIDGNNQMNNLTLEPGKFYEFEQSAVQKILGDFVANGDCSQRTAIRSSVNGTHTILEKTSGQVQLQFIDLMDISATGGATFSASNSFDAGNNLGWTITAAVGADFYWVGDGGSWNDPQHWSLTSGGAPAGCMPTPSDNVFFDANSFTTIGQEVVLNLNGFCKSMDWTGALHNPTFISSDRSLNVHGSLTLISEMKFDFIGDIIFLSNQIGNTITTGNLDLSNSFVFSNDNGAWTLKDSLKTSEGVDLNNGELNTDNNYIEAFSFISNSNSSRILNLGNSFVKVGDSFSVNLTDLAIDPSKTTISFFGSSATFNIYGETNLAGITFDKILLEAHSNAVGFFKNAATEPDKLLFRKAILSRNTVLDGEMKFDSLMMTEGNVYDLSSSDVKTINQYFEARGDCSGAILMRATTPGSEATFSVASGTIDAERIVMRDIHAIGGADFTANNSHDQGNNTGWTFANPLVGTDLFWVGDSGDWHDVTHWSFTSGGPGGACVPTSLDNVFFDAQSFTSAGQGVIVNKVARCRDMDWTGALFNPELTGGESLVVSGSLQFVAGMTYGIGRLTLDAQEPGKIVNTNGVLIDAGVRFSGVGGSWELLGDLTLSAGSRIDQGAGLIKTNGHTLTGGELNSSSNEARELNLGASEIRVKDTYINFSEDFTFDLSNSKFILEGENPSLRMDVGTDQVIEFGDVEMISIDERSGQISVDNLIGNHKTPGFKKVDLKGSVNIFLDQSKIAIDSLLFEAGFRYTIGASDTIKVVDHFLADGSCAGRLTIESSDPGGSPFFMEKSAGDVTINYISLKGSHIFGPGQFNANNTLDLGNNDGWLIDFEIGTDLYWVGGTGDWGDAANWALTSGGPGGACVPFIFDNVFFDENSFDSADQQVTLNKAAACKSMNWTGAQFNPIFTGNQSLELFGSMILNSDMRYEHSDRLIFRSDSLGNQIESRGTSIAARVSFDGDGEWILIDDMIVSADVTFNTGKLDLNKNTLGTRHFISDNQEIRTLAMADATIIATADFQSVSLNTTNLGLAAEGSTFNITGSSNPDFLLQGTDSVVLGSVLFNTVNSGNNVRARLNTQSYDFIGVFEDVSFNGNGAIEGSHQFRNLTFAPGQIYEFEANSKQTILADWTMIGIGCSPIIIESSRSGQKFNVTKTSGTVNGLYLRLSDSDVSGGATFIATNSTDVSNNSGWTFSEEAIVVEDILGLDQIVCEGDPVVLDASFGAANETFIWSDGSTASTLNVTQSGKYWVGVTLGQSCLLSDTVNVTFKPLPIADLGPDLTTCEEQPVILDATNTDPAVTYLWNNGSTLPTLTADTTGTYWVEVTLDACPVRDSIIVTVDPIPRIELGPDISALCADGPVKLDATFDDITTYSWQDGSTNPILEVVSPGTYSVTLTRNGCVFSDEIVVNMPDFPQVDLGPDQAVCPSEANFLDATQSIAGEFTYLWSDGSETPIIQVENEGEFWVTVSNGSCSETDTLTVSYIAEPVADLGPDIIICEGDVLTLDALSAGASYLWSTGETTASIEVTEAGIYSVQLSDGCHTFSDEIMIEVDILPTVDLGPDVGICFYDTLMFDVSINSVKAEYLWENGSTDPERIIYEEGIYSVSVTNAQCGTVTDEIVVSRDFCGCEIFAPNVFSPNGDGSNDVFLPVLSCTPDTYILSVYNRWGVLVFRTSDPEEGWDGRFKGEFANGNFLWVASYTSVRTNGSVDRVSGNGVFRLLR